MAATNSNRYEEVSSTLLFTEFVKNKEAMDKLKSTVEEQRDEIKRRLNMGLDVGNEKSHAEIQEATYKTYNVREAITQVRKHKLDPAAVLKVQNKGVQALPPHIAEKISFVTDTSEKVVVKPNK